MDNTLSPILQLSNDLNSSIDIAYKYFADNIGNRAKRPALFEKEVFIECGEKIDDRPVGFWHMVSIEEKHGFEDLLPCTNDQSLSWCDQNCNTNQHQVAIKYGQEKRNLCLYRAARLPWILDIIKFANRDDPAVQVWLVPGGSKKSDKLYLRYNQKGNDYLLVFSVEKHYYRLISSFPVFYLREKKTLTENYQTYKWSYFDK